MEKILWDILKALERNSPVTIGGSRGASGALLCSLIVERSQRPVLVLVSNSSRAEAWFRDLGSFSSPDVQVEIFPAWEVLPFENASPFLKIQCKRLQLLRRMLLGDPPSVLIVPVEALITKVPPRYWLERQSLFLTPGANVNLKDLVSTLDGWGYQRVALVEEVGDYSVRGGIVDCFPPELEEPVRMEFAASELESLRSFSPETQRSTGKLKWVEILPVKEIPWSSNSREKALSRVGERLPAMVPLGLTGILEGLREGLLFPGAEFLSPLFHPSLETILDYLSKETVLLLEEPMRLDEEIRAFWARVEARSEMEGLPLATLVEPQELYWEPKEALESLGEFANLRLEAVPMERPLSMGEHVSVDIGASLHDGLRVQLREYASGKDPMGAVARKLREWRDEGLHVHWFARTSVQAKKLGDHLKGQGLNCRLECPQGRWAEGNPAIWIRTGEVSQGFVSHVLGLVVVTEEEVFGPQTLRSSTRKPRRQAALSHLEELQEGDLVVHVDHGIGIYRGLKTLEAGGVKGDFLQLEYMGGDRLYVPVERFQKVHRYLGTEETLPRLDRLGGTFWESRKRRVQRAVEKMAKELLELYATREVIQGHAFSPPDSLYEEFVKGFPYEETPDQRRAIEEVMADMGSPRPMDRIICGDVGFGKTEVAMRAAFRAVMDGKQVAYLVPTTLLAEQQYRSFLERFRGYPVVIEVLSRFKTDAHQRSIIGRCARGEVDILIGTHRLLQKDVEFKDLGLLILDEEHRFGVAQKERLKKIKKEVDVLTLTATPIPRTLHMALVGIRDLSVIETPPPDRLSIKTVVAPFEEGIVREAVERERARGGQIFFVHNRVQGIEAIARTLREWLPGVRMEIAHGQMPERELARVMERFHAGEVEMLVCTTIIEAGLDIPTANTILVNDAHKLGLAEMHQIRGRVGRSGHQAYAYLLIPDKGAPLSPEAMRRLQSLQEFSELGAGFRIATRDLEIRGAGTLLGPSQSGHIEAVGFELYTQLIQRAVASLKGEEIPEEIEPEIQLPVHARIPEEYVPDPHQRLALYRRLARCDGEEELWSMREELEDRYGPLPEEAQHLLQLLELRSLLKAIRVTRLTMENGALRLVFHPTTRVSPQRIVQLVQKWASSGMRLLKDDTLEIPATIAQREAPTLVAIRQALKELFLDDTMVA
jgi:transcription-repair coupling factor (superfamily II helicase)